MKNLAFNNSNNIHLNILHIYSYIFIRIFNLYSKPIDRTQIIIIESLSDIISNFCITSNQISELQSKYEMLYFL